MKRTSQYEVRINTERGATILTLPYLDETYNSLDEAAKLFLEIDLNLVAVYQTGKEDTAAFVSDYDSVELELVKLNADIRSFDESELVDYPNLIQHLDKRNGWITRTLHAYAETLR